MKYFEVEESQSSERQDAGEEKPTVIDVIPEYYLISHSDIEFN